MTIAAKALYLLLEPITPATAGLGSVYVDSTNGNALTYKDMGGTSTQIGASSGGGGPASRQMQAGAPIAINKPVSKRADGKIVVADADGPGAQKVVGFALAAAVNVNDLIPILPLGAIITGAIAGLGFAPGDTVYISETAGYTNDPNAINPATDSLIQIGVADCAAGAASTTAVDLIVITKVVLEPSGV